MFRFTKHSQYLAEKEYFYAWEIIFLVQQLASLLKNVTSTSPDLISYMSSYHHDYSNPFAGKFLILRAF